MPMPDSCNAPAVFLDRDGTILDELGYLTPDSTIHIYPFSIDAIRLLARAGFAVVVITNQGGIGLGLYDHAFVDRTHAMLSATVRGGRRRRGRLVLLPASSRGGRRRVEDACANAASRRRGSSPSAARDLDLDLVGVVGGRRSVARHRGGASHRRTQRPGADRVRPRARSEMAGRHRAADDRRRQPDGGSGGDPGRRRGWGRLGRWGRQGDHADSAESEKRYARLAASAGG